MTEETPIREKSATGYTSNDELREFIEEKRDAYEEFALGGSSVHNVMDQLEAMINE